MQMSLAQGARITPAVLSELLAGKRGASLAVAERLAKALDCDPGVIFPELVGFTVAVRYFTANGAPE
jgi:transcriptional regulator with XRE-family HTH domain